jgi:2-polyprenyl-6-methoxyphenol hydroxylase-like FAD-dependent oxidoreductase
MAGQGLNLGLADAETLAQELSSARAAGRDWTSLRTLSRYERARQAENLEMMALTEGLHRAFRLSLPGAGTLLSRGLQLVDRLAPIKRALIRRAQG